MWKLHNYRWRDSNFDPWSLSSEGYLAFYTYCDTGHLFIMVIYEDPWQSQLFPGVWQWRCQMRGRRCNRFFFFDFLYILIFFFSTKLDNTSVCVCVCVCEWEREYCNYYYTISTMVAVHIDNKSSLLYVLLSMYCSSDSLSRSWRMHIKHSPGLYSIFP